MQYEHELAVLGTSRRHSWLEGRDSPSARHAAVPGLEQPQQSDDGGGDPASQVTCASQRTGQAVTATTNNSTSCLAVRDDISQLHVIRMSLEENSIGQASAEVENTHVMQGVDSLHTQAAAGDHDGNAELELEPNGHQAATCKGLVPGKETETLTPVKWFTNESSAAFRVDSMALQTERGDREEGIDLDAEPERAGHAHEDYGRRSIWDFGCEALLRREDFWERVPGFLQVIHKPRSMDPVFP